MEINEIVSTDFITECNCLYQFACSWKSLQIPHFNDCHSNKVVISLFVYRKGKIDIP